MRVAVFDLDGTLADTSADLIAAANGALAEAGLGTPLDPARDQSLAFAGGRAMLREGLGPTGGAGRGGGRPALSAAPRDLRRQARRAHPALRGRRGGARRGSRPPAGGSAICTNKPERLALLLIDELGLGRHFAALLGADSLPVRKPDPRHLLETIARAGGVPERAVLIGDTVTDREAARAAGVPCVLVGFGPDGAAVAALEPEALLAHFDDLPDAARAPGAAPS